MVIDCYHQDNSQSSELDLAVFLTGRPAKKNEEDHCGVLHLEKIVITK